MARAAPGTRTRRSAHCTCGRSSTCGATALGEIKSWLDPRGLMNPGKIVDPPKMDDASLFRFKPGYRAQVSPTVLDWSEWGGYDKAVERCNNNGHCRKFDAGTMCPSFR